ncbi:hypothetical protein [Bacillus sp. MUM 13]|uniref:hypothetical protein n=1 Tax=Bacillus sp. MUM 13 TaxID=1678001 RepID=UPI0008F5DD6C|nr:hypothetical protein [Bacillus sp. MUM 13]OIK11321.1 hypothetical protein BIV59_12645 [Bacillus sp. MUM 13]
MNNILSRMRVLIALKKKSMRRKVGIILNLPEHCKASVEVTKEYLDYFGIPSIEEDILQYAEQGLLSCALPIEDTTKHTDYSYSVDIVSLLLMVNHKGYDFYEARKILER